MADDQHQTPTEQQTAGHRSPHAEEHTGGQQSSMAVDRTWWKEAIVYQIYPRSFNDTDGDGIGDIPGIIEKLDYLDELGVDIVWINPVYESPLADAGYDISDYRAIHPQYGTMADWERLLESLHERGIRLIMDLVVNHTSDEHFWFRQARKSCDNEYHDYYIWHPGTEEGPPTNWTSAFGGPAWEYDEVVGKYYLHLFDEKQPDLNWENPEVREEIYEMMTWWFEKGIDGFRMDVIDLLSKPRDFPDGDPSQEWVGIEHFGGGPRIDEYLSEMHDRVLDKYDCLTVGETVSVGVDDADQYAGPAGPLDMLFHFEHVTLDYGKQGWWTVRDWDLPEFKSVFTRWQNQFDGWNALYLTNHDQPRIVSRFGDEAHRRKSATLLATFLLTLRGTPFIYQGQELGMTNYPFDSLAELHDAQAVGNVQSAIEADVIENFEEVRDLVRYRTRDNTRTPMQWSGEANAGFTTGDPWLPVNPDYEKVNVERERADPDSVFNFYRDLVALRDEHDELVYGEYHLLLPDHERIYAYTRTLEDRCALVLLNFAAGKTTVTVPDVTPSAAELLLGNYGTPADLPGTQCGHHDSFTLRPYEARVYRLD